MKKLISVILTCALILSVGCQRRPFEAPAETGIPEEPPVAADYYSEFSSVYAETTTAETTTAETTLPETTAPSGQIILNESDFSAKTEISRTEPVSTEAPVTATAVPETTAKTTPFVPGEPVEFCGCEISQNVTAIAFFDGWDESGSMYKMVSEQLKRFSPNVCIYIVRKSVNISELAETFPNVRELYLSASVSDPENLVKLKKLDTLMFWSVEELTDISFLKNISSLKRLYCIFNKNVADFTVLGKLTWLKELVYNEKLTSDEEADISFMKPLVNLEYLSIDGKNMNYNSLSGMKKLKYLEITDYRTTDISPLGSLTALETLDIRADSVKDITPIGKLKNLKTLMLHSMKVVDMSPLKKLDKLEELWLCYLDRADLSGMNGMSNLKDVTLMELPIRNLNAFSDMKNLEFLNCHMCSKLTDVSGVSSLKKLKKLYFPDSSVKDISSLGNMTWLEVLSIGGNPISDPTPILRLKKLIALSCDSEICNEAFIEQYKGINPDCDIILR